MVIQIRSLLESFNNHVVLIADMKNEDSIDSDKTHIFEIPIPKEYEKANGKKKIIVSLAYNPEVRKTRLDYAGCNVF